MAHQPDFTQFLKVLQRDGRPNHLPFYEHLASPGFIATRLGRALPSWGSREYWQCIVDFWLGMGFDCVPIEIPPRLPLQSSDTESGARSHRSEATACLRSLEDFERYPWPEGDPIEFHHFEIVAELLPEGAKIAGGVAAGPFEWATYLMGVEGLALATHDSPELVGLVFEKIGSLHVAANRVLASMDCIGATRQGDDLGFKTATFLPPAALREHILPIYKEMAAIAHAHGKPFILHSCGNLAAIYPNLIDDCRIDAKHSFEEAIMPVEEFQRLYGARMTPLGGLDVDVICRADEAELRTYTRDKIERCFGDGWWALGTGNSLTDYMPVASYLIVLDEARKITA